jgi:autotransporter strand-loop-strand O-heptosyltransferase
MSPRDGSEENVLAVAPLQEATSAGAEPQQSRRSKSSAGNSKPPYPPPSKKPTQTGAAGVTFDFNLGARVVLPPGEWRVRLRDLDSGNVLFESQNKGAFINSSKRFYIRFGLEVWDRDTLVFNHEYDCAGKEVLIQFPIGTLGDILAWFPYAARFGRVHNCKLICAMSPLIIPLLKDAYPEIRFVDHEELVAQKIQDRVYATYCLGLFFDDAENIWQPTDFRHVGLHKTAAYILGVDPAEEPPRLALPDDTRPIPEPYVCIAVQSSSQCKHWNNPDGWRSVVSYFKASGHRVICIDQKPVGGQGIVWTHIPNGAEDETGSRPLVERARWLRHAAVFVGLSSGLSWLAWAAGTPVVMISGFTHPTNEFSTPYRIINWHACNSCWNDVRERFDHKDFLWCPRHAGTTRQFECTKLITAENVVTTIKRVPEFEKMSARKAFSKQ